MPCQSINFEEMLLCYADVKTSLEKLAKRCITLFEASSEIPGIPAFTAAMPDLTIQIYLSMFNNRQYVRLQKSMA